MTALLLKLFGNSTLKYFKNKKNCITSGFRSSNFSIEPTNCRKKCKDEHSIVTRLALPPDYDNVAEFMCDAYYKYEPVIVNIGLGCTEAPPVWRAMMLEQVQAGYSIIAETPDHCLVGAALNIITYDNEAEKLYTLAKCCDQGTISDAIEFFGHVTEKPRLWERYCVSRIFEQKSLAVEYSYQRLGIAKKLIQESWVLARDCGFRLFRLNCTNDYCANIARGFGWPVIWSIPYRQYVKDGEIIFKCVKEPHTVCRVFVDQLRYCKTYCLPYKQCKTVTPPPV